SQEELAEKFLRVSPRTYRQALAEAWQMKRRPELETAYLSGGVGVSRLRSLSPVEPRRLAKFLNRARRVTLRQLKRELRLHEKLVILRDQLQRERSAQERFAERHQDVERGMKPGPNHHCKDRPPVLVLSDSDLDPLPGKELDAKLACILLQHGHLAHELATNLTRPGLCSPEEAAMLLAKARRLADRARSAATRHGYGSRVCSDADSDPHFSNGSGSSSSCGMDLHFSDESGAHAISGSKPHSRDGSDPHSNRRSGADTPDDGAGLHSDGADVGGFEIYQRDPAANPSLMRLLETLVDLALLSVCDDAVLIGSQVSPRGRQSLNHDGDYCRISFWAPDPVIEDLNHFLDHVRERVGPLPAWAALMTLVREAVDTWKKVDPKKKPQFWRVFERDE